MVMKCSCLFDIRFRELIMNYSIRRCTQFVTLLGMFQLVAAVDALAQKKHVPIRGDIPYGEIQVPRMEEPVFAVCSKQGMRILVSRDDGRSWKQTFLGTESLEDGGWHGTFAVYGMAATNGVIGVFSGWGAPGVYIGSSDGIHWSHLNAQPEKLGSVWGAAGGNDVFLTSADQWRGITTSANGHRSWNVHKLKNMFMLLL